MVSDDIYARQHVSATDWHVLVSIPFRIARHAVNHDECFQGVQHDPTGTLLPLNTMTLLPGHKSNFSQGDSSGHSR